MPEGALLYYGKGRDPYCNVTDAADKDGHRFGMKRLREVIQAAGKARPQELGERIDEAVKRHAAGKEPADDMTIVVVRRR